MKVITTYWLSRLIIHERNLLRHYGVAEEMVMKADGSFMRNAFILGWRSCLRRSADRWITKYR